MKIIVVTVLLGVCLLVFAYLVNPPLDVSSFDANPTLVADAKPAAIENRATAASSLPADLVYKVVDETTLLTTKRSLVVRLNRRVSEDVLRSIARKLLRSDPKHYQRTFIEYYLPGMVVNSGAWATTHFNPNLRVRILGLTVEQENALTQEPVDPSREIIGSWIDETLSSGKKIAIFRQDEKLFIEKTYPDGSIGNHEIDEQVSTDGTKFVEIGNQFGEYFVIDKKGDLQLLDPNGIVSVSGRLED